MIETYATTAVVLTRPAIHKLKIAGLKEEHAAIQGYWWVRLTDLLTCIRCVVIGNRAMRSMSVASEFFSRYGLLCDHKDGKPQVTWATPYLYEVDSERWPSDEQRHGTYVPLGFSNAALDLAEQGIVRVRAIYIFGRYELEAEFIDGTKKKLIRDGRHGPYKVTSAS